MAIRYTEKDKKIGNITDPVVDPIELQNKASEDYEVKARDWLINEGADFGITNEMIGWNPETKSIMLNGDDFMKAGRLENGSSYVSNNDIRSAFDQYTKSRGLQSKSQKYDIGNYGYNDTDYSAKIDSILNEILNPTPFSYNAESDPSFQAYKEQYGRAGDKALANTMSEASALTGGRLNTWAVSAGNQAKANFDEELMNVIPQLENMAYGRYQDGINGKRSNLNTLLDIDNREFQRALEGRDFAYGLDRDSISDARYTDETKYNRAEDAEDDEWRQTEWDYGVGRDAIGDQRYNDETAWNKKMDQDANSRAWANYNLSKDEFAYRKTRDEIEDAAKNANVENVDEFGVLFGDMESGVIRDIDGNVIKENVTPREWLVYNAPYLTKEEIKALEDLIKYEGDGMSFTIVPSK